MAETLTVSPADCRVIISDDRLKLSLEPVGEARGESPALAQVHTRLREAGFPPDARIEQALAPLLVDGGFVRLTEPVVLLEGVAPVDELPMRLEPLPLPDVEPLQAEDHYNRTRINVIRAGVPVARLLPGSTGRPGRNIFNETIPFRKPRILEPNLGPNVRLDPATGIVTTTCEGSLQLESHHADVENLLRIAGDVDFSTGNIDFKGDVLIEGSVGDLFTVSAASIHIHGTVEAATICASANLFVAGGIVAKEKGSCSAGHALSARFISNARVDCGGGISVLSEINNSQVTCRGHLVVDGAILGGHICANGGVTVRSIGSTAEARTIVEAGSDPALEAEAEPKLKELEARKEQIDRTRQMVAPLMKNAKALTPSQREKATELLYQADEQEEALKKAAGGLLEELQQAQELRKAEIEVIEKVYPGSVLRFQGLQATVKTPINGPARIALRHLRNETRIMVTSLNRHSSYALDAMPVDVSPVEKRLQALLA